MILVSKPRNVTTVDREYKTLSDAFRAIATHYGVATHELTTESNGPGIDPTYGHGLNVWTYAGEFDADTAFLVWVPELTARAWISTVGVARVL